MEKELRIEIDPQFWDIDDIKRQLKEKNADVKIKKINKNRVDIIVPNENEYKKVYDTIYKRNERNRMKKSELRQIIREEVKSLLEYKYYLDSEYLQRSAEDFAEELLDDNYVETAELLELLSDRLHQSYPGNLDLTKEDIYEILKEPIMRRKVKRAEREMGDSIDYVVDELFV